MRKVCKTCGKKVPKRYVEAHYRYHVRNGQTIDREKEYRKTLRKIVL
jgi:hypothetical protein